MSYMQKALSLVQSGETIQFIKPWWDVVEQFTIDAMMLVAVTSVTADLFQGELGLRGFWIYANYMILPLHLTNPSLGKGALQCIPHNKTLHFEPQQQFFVNQECTEQWPIYAKYFPYFLFFQVSKVIKLKRKKSGLDQHNSRTRTRAHTQRRWDSPLPSTTIFHSASSSWSWTTRGTECARIWWRIFPCWWSDVTRRRFVGKTCRS